MQVDTDVFSLSSNTLLELDKIDNKIIYTSQQSARLCNALRHRRLTMGQGMAPLWTCMNESDGIKALGQQATHSASSVSPVWRSPASFTEDHFVEPVRVIFLNKHWFWTS